jgi:hypothetical protein
VALTLLPLVACPDWLPDTPRRLGEASVVKNAVTAFEVYLACASRTRAASTATARRTVFGGLNGSQQGNGDESHFALSVVGMGNGSGS